MTTTTTRAADDAARARRDKDLVRKVREGVTLAQAGEQCDPPISGERVRQIVTRLDAEAVTAGRAARERNAPDRAAPTARLATCAICGREFRTTNPRRKTCSGILSDPMVVAEGSTVIAGGESYTVKRDEPLFITGHERVQVVPPEGGRGKVIRLTGARWAFFQTDTCADVHRRGWATPELRERRNTRTAKHIMDAERDTPGRYPAANVRWAERFLRARGLLDGA